MESLYGASSLIVNIETIDLGRFRGSRSQRLSHFLPMPGHRPDAQCAALEPHSSDVLVMLGSIGERR